MNNSSNKESVLFRVIQKSGSFSSIWRKQQLRGFIDHKRVVKHGRVAKTGVAQDCNFGWRLGNTIKKLQNLTENLNLKFNVSNIGLKLKVIYNKFK